MLDLAKLPSWYLTKYGRDKVAEVTSHSGAVVDFFISRNDFPLSAIQKLLEFDPEPLGEVKPLYENPVSEGKLAIVACSNRKPEPHMVTALFKMYDSKTMVYEPFGFNSLFHTRNMAAAWFLGTGIPWSFWPDDDSILPCGDAKWYKRVTGLANMPDSFAGVHTINRLLATGKKVVGVSYVSRSDKATPQFAGGNTLEMSEQMRAGPRNMVLKRDWVGFHGVLVHRDVFQDIIKTQGDEIRVRNDHIRTRLAYDFSFFRPIEDDVGDDISFCARARKAGHEVFVDLAISAAHIGSKPYSYQDIRRR